MQYIFIPVVIISLLILSMFLFPSKLDNILDFFKIKKKEQRLKLKDVMPGELINIEWNRVAGKLANLKCINNDPKTKKILLEVHWGNHKQLNLPEFERVVFSYKDVELKNYHLINQKNNVVVPVKTKEEILKSLEKKIKKCLEKEEYEKIPEIQKKIDELKLNQVGINDKNKSQNNGTTI